MSMTYSPIILYGLNVNEFELKKEFKEKFESWGDLISQSDITITVKDRDGYPKKVYLVWDSTDMMYDEERFYIGMLSHFDFGDNGAYFRTLTKDEIDEAIVTLMLRYSTATEEEIRRHIDFIYDVSYT